MGRVALRATLSVWAPSGPYDSAILAQRPFGEIALSFSGGGVRAVGFHLGSLSYLDHVGLREDVKILSTVSGGTFVGLSTPPTSSSMARISISSPITDPWFGGTRNPTAVAICT